MKTRQQTFHQPEDCRSDVIIVIGPIGVGKSTLARLLAKKLQIPHCPMDALRWDYYKEIGYDEELAKKINEKEEFLGLYRYWKPFEAHAVERILAENSKCVIDFGGGHSVYEDDELFTRIQRILAPYENIVLVLPSPDLDESVRVLNERNGNMVSKGFDFNEHFVKHHSNHDLAKIVVYTEGKSPEETCDEILRLIKF
jgi:shikimate kinase